MAYAVGEACVRLHLAEKEVCRSITELFRADFLEALQKSLLSPSEACALLVGPSCGKFDLYAPWNITLPKVPKPDVTPPSPPKPGSPKSRVLFLTDIHWDQVSKQSHTHPHHHHHPASSIHDSVLQLSYFLKVASQRVCAVNVVSH